MLTQPTSHTIAIQAFKREVMDCAKVRGPSQAQRALALTMQHHRVERVSQLPDTTAVVRARRDFFDAMKVWY